MNKTSTTIVFAKLSKSYMIKTAILNKKKNFAALNNQSLINETNNFNVKQ